MARYDVATLAVKLVGDAQGFEKTLAGAERKMQSFANKLAAPVNMLRGVAGGISDTMINPFNALLTDMTRFTSMIPGFGAISAAIASPIKAAETAMKRLDELGDQAERIGVGGQFLRGLQIGADDEAAAIEPTLLRLLKFQSQLRQGSSDLLTAGGKSATKKASELGLDIEAWKAANPEQLFALFAKGAQQAAKSGTEFAFATDIAGKGASGLMRTLLTGAWQEYTEKIKNANVATESAIALAQTWDDLQKDIAIHHERSQERMMGAGGLMSLGLGKAFSGDGSRFREGMQEWSLGIDNWVRQLIGKDAMMPAQMGEDLLKSVDDAIQKGIRAPEKDLAKLAEVQKEYSATVRAIEALGQRGEMMPMPTFEKFANLLQQAKSAVIKTKPGDPAEQAAEQAGKVLETALEPLGDMDKDAIWALNKAMRTPAEIAEDELAKLDQLMSTGKMGSDTYQRALERLKRGFDKPTLKGAKEADVDIAGSQEWAKAFNRTSEGIEDKTEEQLQEDRRQTEVLKRIEDAIKITKPKVLNAPP
jgi:hypothetical protein